jgi:hypothetical protein
MEGGQRYPASRVCLWLLPWVRRGNNGCPGEGRLLHGLPDAQPPRQGGPGAQGRSATPLPLGMPTFRHWRVAPILSLLFDGDQTRCSSLLLARRPSHSYSSTSTTLDPLHPTNWGARGNVKSRAARRHAQVHPSGRCAHCASCQVSRLFAPRAGSTPPLNVFSPGAAADHESEDNYLGGAGKEAAQGWKQCCLPARVAAVLCGALPRLEQRRRGGRVHATGSGAVRSVATLDDSRTQVEQGGGGGGRVVGGQREER